MSYLMDTAVTRTVALRDVDGNLANTTSMVCTALKPDGTTTTIPVTNPSTGMYTIEFTPDVAGVWYLEFQASGTIVAAGEDSFVVRATKVDG